MENVRNIYDNKYINTRLYSVNIRKLLIKAIQNVLITLTEKNQQALIVILYMYTLYKLILCKLYLIKPYQILLHRSYKSFTLNFVPSPPCFLSFTA